MRLRNIHFVIVILSFASAIATQISGQYATEWYTSLLRTLGTFFSFWSGDGDTLGRLLTPEEGCGLTKVKNTRIVGGSKAEKGIMCGVFFSFDSKQKLHNKCSFEGAWPWMTLLAYFEEFRISFLCGKSINKSLISFQTKWNSFWF